MIIYLINWGVILFLYYLIQLADCQYTLGLFTGKLNIVFHAFCYLFYSR